MKNRIVLAAAIIGLLATSCKKENDTPQQAELMQSPITINATYKTDNGAKVDYTENENTISATWEADDEILVVYDGRVSTLTLTTGAGTSSATFSGEITYTNEPSANSVLSCYVRDAKNQGALTIEDDNIVYSDAAFLAQNGTVAGAGKCNTYMGMATYGDGTNITCNFGVNTSMCKFAITNLALDADKEATLEYVSGSTTVAKATFTVANGTNTVYLAVPAGSYSGTQKLVYNCATSSITREYYILGDHANFAVGQTFSKNIAIPTIIDLSTLTSALNALDGYILTSTLTAHYDITVAEGASVTLRNASINPNHSYISPHGACIRCDNDATIVIEGTNDMYVWTEQMPCIYIATGKTLTIIGNGSLNASSTGMITAAIGGCYSSGNSCGNIVIESGNITATAGSCAAIGGGFYGNCGDITINGGTIQATSTGGTAIGCGNQGYYSCGNITINGGNITATGSRAGIGGGYYSSCGDITITGGTVIASGNSGSGIGAGLWRDGNVGLCGNITISGGNVTASSTGGVGIGGGQQAGCGDILISGGTVTATGGNNYVAIGASTNNTCGTITITEGVESVTATKGSNAPRCIGLGNGDYGTCGTVTIGGTVYPDGATPNQTDGLTFVYPAPEPTEQIVDLSTITTDYTAVDGDILINTLGTGVQISIADGATVTLRSANINGSDNLSGTFHGLKCLGDATIILENNDNVVKAKCGSSYDGRAGIFVPRDKTLTIQAGNSSGKIEATGAGEAAGIGGYYNTHCGAIVINSGKVTAEAGSNAYDDGYGAGIGACGYKRCDGITITGGQTIARAYGYAAAIGTGGDDMMTGYCNPGDQAAITINISSGDGWVKAYKGSNATYFIGGGTSTHCGYVTVGGITYEDNGNRGITSSTPTSSDLLVGETSVVYMP